MISEEYNNKRHEFLFRAVFYDKRNSLTPSAYGIKTFYFWDKFGVLYDMTGTGYDTADITGVMCVLRKGMTQIIRGNGYGDQLKRKRIG